MPLFKRNKRDTKTVTNGDKNTAIQTEQSKLAQQEAVHRAKVANAELTRLLVENGFTLKIYLAAGGRHPRTTRRTTQ